MELGQTTKFGYYTQEEQVFKPDMRVLDVVKEVADVIKLANGSEITASQLLNQFLFPPKMQFNVVGKLSGGEKRRLQLLRVLMLNPNFLILDEPTNDLDLLTLNVLEDYLDSFEGCLMIVSHDRYFMDRLSDHLFVFQGDGKIKDFPGNYTDLRESDLMPSSGGGLSGNTERKTKKTDEKSASTKVAVPVKKLTYNEQREFTSLEDEIAKLETKKSEIEKALTLETEYAKLQECASEINKVNKDLESKEMRWLELSERV